jgi:RNA polymerase sigma factor (sigma-70 family)
MGKASDLDSVGATDLPSAGQERLAELLERVAAADRVAFEELYRRSAGTLFAVCFRILGDRPQAEDALQETCLSVWRRAASFDRRRGNPMTWLITLARNRAVDRLRARRSPAEGSLLEAGEIADGRESAIEEMEKDEEARRLAECLGMLDDKDRNFVAISFFEGATYPELARRASMPLSTVKSRMRRALLKLRDCLE